MIKATKVTIAITLLIVDIMMTTPFLFKPFLVSTIMITKIIGSGDKIVLSFSLEAAEQIHTQFPLRNAHFKGLVGLLN